MTGQREYPDRPIVGVGAVVVRDGHVLLVQRAQEPLSGKWTLPGGAVELGETLEEAVVRELREETGLDVRVLGLIEAFDRMARDEHGRVQYHYVLLDYLCVPVSGELLAGSDVAAAEWVRPDDFPRYQVSEKARSICEKGLALLHRRAPHQP
ncbi:MAG TPA: NUDIX hydrolase [Candidatus Xenobia bacterium]|nr:NUDIX hydrolase [Candidatus Xenobia bacterium]